MININPFRIRNCSLKSDYEEKIVIRKTKNSPRQVLSPLWSRRYVYQLRIYQGKQDHWELWDKGFTTGAGASTVWRELRDAGPGWRLAVGCRLLLVNRVSSDAIARNRREENEMKLEPASVSASFVSTSNHSDLHSGRSGCCLTSASKSHVSSSLGLALTQGPNREGANYHRMESE